MHKNLYNEIAEQELIGSLLVDNDLFVQVENIIQSQHFGNKVNGIVFDAISANINRFLPANPKSIYIELEKCEALNLLGGLEYLNNLAKNITSLRNIIHFAQIIYDLAVKRNLIKLSSDIEEKIISDSGSISDCIIEIENKIFDLTKDRYGYSFRLMQDVVSDSIESIEKAFKHQGHLGIDTGLYDLDSFLGGMHNSDLIILAGRPSMGKTALATSIAHNTARINRDSNGEKGAKVAFFSLEMSCDQLATRILSEISQIPAYDMRQGKISQSIFNNKIITAAQDLRTIPIYIDDTPCISIEQMSSRARKLKKMHNIGLIVVDYLQLMRSGSKRSSENRVLEISEITQGLKSIAKILNVPVLALSQLSRSVESREDKKPQLSDLRESGSIEQDADIVMFVYREEYYLRNKEPAPNTTDHEKWKIKMEEALGKAEVIIGKQRHGPTGSVKLLFDSRHTSFKSIF